ncbi:MAG: hypothetical protein AB1797_06855 [bacterium]
MKAGSTFRILFLNPMWDLIEQIATQEGRGSAKELYLDLRTTCSIVKKLWDKLSRQNQLIDGSIEIRVYQEISQYAYHYVKDLPTGDIEMLVGFYFAELLGWQSALFEVQNEGIQKSFEDHFAVLFRRARQILIYPSGGGGAQNFDNYFYQQILTYLESKIK